MSQVTGFVRNGRIEIPAPIGLEEGSEVKIWVDAVASLHDVDGSMTAEEIQRTLEAMERFAQESPPDESGEDLSQAAREAGEWERAHFETRAEKLRGFVE